MDNIAQEVHRIFRDCLFRDEEVTNGTAPDDAVIVDGVLGKFGLHPQRLESHRDEVAAILREMPPDFQASIGGGMSFLELCMDRNDNQWGEHLTMNELVVLAIGLKLGSYCLPREMWNILPGGMPYVVFDVPAAA